MDILLVEDNPGDAALVRAALAELDQDVSLQVAGDADQAVAALGGRQGTPGQSFDLLLLDLNLPRISGIQLLERLESEGFASGCRMVVFSSSADPRDRAAVDRPLVARFARKPDGYPELVELLRELLSEVSDENA